MLELESSPTTCPVTLLRTVELRHPERLVRNGTVVRIRPGMYARRAEWSILAPWQRYLARVFAVSTSHTDPVFSHESAAALLGLPVLADRGIVHLLGPSGAPSRRIDDVRWHTSAGDQKLVEVNGFVVTSPADTAVDLARSRHPAIGLAVADAALRIKDGVSAEQLIAINEARTTSRGRNIARWPLRRAHGAAESPLESISRACIEWLGFPDPQLQVRFRTDAHTTDRADFWWPDVRLIGESDGDQKYNGSLGDPLDALQRRRTRDARLLRHHARKIAHWDWHEAIAASPLRTILIRSGLRPVTPEHTAPLASLRRTLSARSDHETTLSRRDEG